MRPTEPKAAIQFIDRVLPRLPGKVERSIEEAEFERMLEGVVVDDTQLSFISLQEREHFDNFERPHTGLGGQTPYEPVPRDDGASG